MPPLKGTRPRLSNIFAIALAATLSAAALIAYFRIEAREAVAVAKLKSRADEIPPTVLWAWERPEDLSFLDPREAGVAYLSRTIHLRGEETLVRPRFQPLNISPQTYLIAVVRIETDGRATPSLSAAQVEQTATAAAESAQAVGVRALQIDFDAVVSEREFYRYLLTKLRAKLPERTPLSITALASWCLRDDWLARLDVDEAVPMLFRMGVDDHRIKNFLEGGGEFTSPLCRSSAGLSTDERVRVPREAARRYVFNPRGWTKDSARSVIEEHER
ncbi:MAG TPA: DUF3142 domain-containing protein [Pyrinomonadaceae bacterium]|nr:DUF3142 domain-containing protein [Pyrinomonadaceae bacterium]